MLHKGVGVRLTFEVVQVANGQVFVEDFGSELLFVILLLLCFLEVPLSYELELIFKGL